MPSALFRPHTTYPDSTGEVTAIRTAQAIPDGMGYHNHGTRTGHEIFNGQMHRVDNRVVAHQDNRNDQGYQAKGSLVKSNQAPTSAQSGMRRSRSPTSVQASVQALKPPISPIKIKRPSTKRLTAFQDHRDTVGVMGGVADMGDGT